MNQKSIRIVIRQPLHALLQKWADILQVDDFGEVVNFLLLDLNRSGYQPNKASNQNESHLPTDTTTEIDDISGLF